MGSSIAAPLGFVLLAAGCATTITERREVPNVGVVWTPHAPQPEPVTKPVVHPPSLQQVLPPWTGTHRVKIDASSASSCSRSWSMFRQRGELEVVVAPKGTVAMSLTTSTMSISGGGAPGVSRYDAGPVVCRWKGRSQVSSGGLRLVFTRQSQPEGGGPSCQPWDDRNNTASLTFQCHLTKDYYAPGPPVSIAECRLTGSVPDIVRAAHDSRRGGLPLSRGAPASVVVVNDTNMLQFGTVNPTFVPATIARQRAVNPKFGALLKLSPPRFIETSHSRAKWLLNPN